MSTIHRPQRLLALAAGALLCFGVPARAVEVEVLDTHVDTDSAKFEEYRDFDSGLRLTFLRLLGESPDQEKTLDLTVVNAPRRDARYTLTYARPGRFTLLLDQNQIQHRFANDATTLWVRNGPGTLEIPDFVQSALQNGTVANPPLLFFPYLNELVSPLFALAPHTDLALQRDRTLLRLGVGSMSPFGWGLEVTREKKHGLRAFGGSFGLFNVTEIPEPIDHDTNGAELSGEWKGKSGGLRFGYRYSQFRNNISTLLWDNPFRVFDSTDPAAFLAPTPLSVRGSSHGIADLAPDNDSNAVFVNGRAQLGKGWWVNGSVTRNQVKQDDQLLAYAVNRAIRLINDDGTPFDVLGTSTLPRQTADREVVTTNANGQLGGRFGLWDLTFRYRYYDYDNRSPVDQFVGYALFHSTFIILDRRTVSYAYTQQDASADLGYRIGSSSRLGLSYTRRSFDREFREVRSSDEDVARLTFDTHPSDRWDLQASAEHGDRTISNYDVLASMLTYINPPGPLNNPDMRKFDEAARTYDSMRVLANLYATDTLNFTVGISGRNEDYDKSTLGVQNDDVVEYNAEVSYTPSDKLSFFLFGTRTDRDSTLRSRESSGIPSLDPADNWQVKLSEITDTAGLGVNARLSSRWTADLTGQWSSSDGKADFDRATGVVAGFGNYDDIDLLSLLAKVDYELTKHFSAGFSYRWEDYTIRSFLTDNLRNYLPGAILLNGNNGDYRAHVVGINVNLNW